MPAETGGPSLDWRRIVSRAARAGVASAHPPDSATGRDGAAAKNARSLHAQGRQGEIRFYLERVAGGLYVEREEIPRRGLQTSQSAHFNDADSFRRWCDDDPVRFAHPVLHVQLKRDADDLWRIDIVPSSE